MNIPAARTAEPSKKRTAQATDTWQRSPGVADTTAAWPTGPGDAFDFYLPALSPRTLSLH